MDSNRCIDCADVFRQPDFAQPWTDVAQEGTLTKFVTSGCSRTICGVPAAGARAQIALAWLLAQKPWIVPIPGTTKIARLEENIGGAGVELTSDDLREIDSAAAKITLQGARYPEKLQQLTGR